MTTTLRRSIGRLAGLVLVALISLQAYFVVRVVAMAFTDPQSTAFQRSEAWRLAMSARHPDWQQQWVDETSISLYLKRAVIASEDAGFTEHSGVEWDALEKAWQRNQRAEIAADQANEQLALREAARRMSAKGSAARIPKVVGGSTITQQLAKNLFLGGERNLARKAQELLLTWELEAMLDKRRILEIYLNNVEWGEGVFGAEAAARHYFHVRAAALSGPQAAQLAVLLPAPKRFGTRMNSGYVNARAATIAARMDSVDVP